VTGEHRFLGLWTSTAYHRSPRDIPVLRRKIEQVIDHFGLDPQSHDGKAVLNVLDTYPRDELFQAPASDLIRIARSVVNLYERRTVRMLVRRDPYNRFYSCMIYVPRDRYSTDVRQRIEQIVREGFAGQNIETQCRSRTRAMRACTSWCARIGKTAARWISTPSSSASRTPPPPGRTAFAPCSAPSVRPPRRSSSLPAIAAPSRPTTRPS
jgi:hypothetical protein